MDEIAKERTNINEQNRFASKFPFSAEIISNFNKLWMEAQENCQDQEMETSQYFLYCFQAQNNVLWQTLRSLSLQESALNAFVHDVVQSEIFMSITERHSDKVDVAVKFISDQMNEVGQENSLALVFTICKDFQDQIIAVAPLLHFASGVPETVLTNATLTEYVLQDASLNLSRRAKALGYTKKEITEFIKDADVLRMCSAQAFEYQNQSKIDLALAFQIDKISFFVMFLREFNCGLNENLSECAFEGGKNSGGQLRVSPICVALKYSGTF